MTQQEIIDAISKLVKDAYGNGLDEKAMPPEYYDLYRRVILCIRSYYR